MAETPALQIYIYKGGPDRYFYDQSEGHFGAQKVKAPSKSQDFHGDPLEMAQVMAFPATKWLSPAPKVKKSVGYDLVSTGLIFVSYTFAFLI